MRTGVSNLLCALLAVIGARVQCPNNSIGVGVIGLCQGTDPNSGGTGSWNERATHNGTNLCGHGYSGGAYVTCNGNTITGVNVPGEGRTPCSSINIVEMSFEGIINIYACCHL
ncbi:hypothetical protein B0H10DRAFT_2229463 [Mycena sp. CBHHK59/15]|nr:hypothetical protein B0H10DRAFT_2229463 [Mycena sp. CBHHK59/15]